MTMLMTMRGGKWTVCAALGFVGLCGLSGLPGCVADTDACRGHSETCISLTLSGAEGVDEVDQLEVLVSRKTQPQMPTVLGEPRALPFKVAILWPDGPGTIKIQSYLQGQLNGISAELMLDLRSGEHERRKMTLFPPLSGKPLGDMYKPPPDMAMPPDMAKPDMAMPDMAKPDMAMPDMAKPDMTMPKDMAVPDLSAPKDLPVPGDLPGLPDLGP